MFFSESINKLDEILCSVPLNSFTCLFTTHFKSSLTDLQSRYSVVRWVYG